MVPLSGFATASTFFLFLLGALAEEDLAAAAHRGLQTLSCPNQEPCQTNAYDTYRINGEKGTCRQVCAGGSGLTERFDSGYKCGTCHTYYNSLCPGQAPCNEYGEGYLGYNIYKVGEDGTCAQRCTAGNLLVRRLSRDYVCGTCPERETPKETEPPPLPSQPRCDDQEPCRMFGRFPAYSIHKISTRDGTCAESCAASTTLTERLREGYVCGPC